ncbi:MAG: cytochrome c-type biogenesis protein CcmH [Candidatus Latescibacterota bacterium]|jgi:cytochrome c-type biogenesis protein CcmH
MKLAIWIFLTICTIAQAGAQDLEKAARDIEGDLMAPCCWAQTIDKHTSSVAKEMRLGVKEMLTQGESKDEIIAHYVRQYGQRILAVPPATGFNLTVFVLPGLFLIGGGWVVVLVVQRWRQEHLGEPQYAQVIVADGLYAERLVHELRKRE